MKIGILTQPLVVNYGGLLQAYALKETLERMGHEVFLIDVRYCNYNYSARFRHLASKFLDTFSVDRRKYQKKIINGTNFKAKYIVDFINKPVEKYHFEAIIVGSDQVWRPTMNTRIENMFLDFVKDRNDLKRIAYAASFGIDYWEFNDAQTQNCKALIRKFDAISVREDSGIDLCEKYFDVNAVQVLDPTMLLDKSYYENIANSTAKIEKSLFTYFLDQTNLKESVVESVSEKLKLSVNSIALRTESENENQPFPPLSAWLSGIMSADFVVTDSFHGCVFSILFNRPFIVIANPLTGIARLSSLLKTFGLEDRLMDSNMKFDGSILNKTMDFESINNKLKKEKMISFQYLNDSLK